jgi:release factor glutamine methyltransferase
VTRDDLAARRGVETAVYQPAEDSALLARAAVGTVSPGDRVLEVGTGSGWVAARVASETGARVVASDLNPHACRQARERAEAPAGDGAGDESDRRHANRGDERPGTGDGTPGFDVVTADLVSAFAAERFDCVLFNPPYLPTDPDNEWDDWMERALSGGESGRAVIEPFLDTVGRVLAPDGRVLLLVSSLAGYEAVLDHARARGFSADKAVEESYPFETLTVVSMTDDAD